MQQGVMRCDLIESGVTFDAMYSGIAVRFGWAFRGAMCPVHRVWNGLGQVTGSCHRSSLVDIGLSLSRTCKRIQLLLQILHQSQK